MVFWRVVAAGVLLVMVIVVALRSNFTSALILGIPMLYFAGSAIFWARRYSRQRASGSR